MASCRGRPVKTTPEHLFEILARVGVLSAEQVRELAQRWTAHLRVKPPRRHGDGRPDGSEGERHEIDLLDFIVGQRVRGLAGVTVMGDGRTVLLLDLAALI